MPEPEPELLVHCTCGHTYSLHTYTICPECFLWPSMVVKCERPWGLQCPQCGGVGCVKCNGTNMDESEDVDHA